MSDASSNAQPDSNYVPPAFYFKFVIAGAQGDQFFQEVIGIASELELELELELEEVTEGGENRFLHRLPKGTKHPPLELKRGILSGFADRQRANLDSESF